MVTYVNNKVFNRHNFVSIVYVYKVSFTKILGKQWQFSFRQLIGERQKRITAILGGNHLVGGDYFIKYCFCKE